MATWALVLRTQAQFQAGSLHCRVTSTRLNFSDSPFLQRREQDDRGLAGAGSRTHQSSFKAWQTVAPCAHCFIEIS